MRKFFLILLLVAFSVLPVAQASEESAYLQVSLWDETQLATQQAVAAAYMAEHPSVQIDVQLLPAEDHWAQLDAGATGGMMPDVFQIDPDRLVQYAGAGLLLPTEAVIQPDAYPDGLATLFAFDGTAYAVPASYQPTVLVYNKSLFDSAGEAYPDASWTWETMRAAAQRLTDTESGRYGFAATLEATHGFFNYIYQNDGFVFDAEAKTSGFDLPETQDALAAWIGFGTVDAVSPDVQALADTSVAGMFRQGEVAIFFAGQSDIGDLLCDSATAPNVGLAPLPAGTKQATVFTGQGWAGAVNTAYPDIVQDFLSFCASETADAIAVENGGWLPARVDAADAYVQRHTEPAYSAFTSQQASGVPVPEDATKPLWADRITEELSLVYGGSRSLEDACENIHVYINTCVAGEQ